MYVFGGYEEEIDQFSQDVHMLDLRTMEWRHLTPKVGLGFIIKLRGPSDYLEVIFRVNLLVTVTFILPLQLVIVCTYLVAEETIMVLITPRFLDRNSTEALSS